MRYPYRMLLVLVFLASAAPAWGASEQFKYRQVKRERAALRQLRVALRVETEKLERLRGRGKSFILDVF